MEKFNISQNNNVPFRNRTEKYMVDYIKKLLDEKMDMTIEQLRNHIIYTKATYIEANPSHGGIIIRDIHTTTTIMGKEHICLRAFGLYGKNRKTYTLSISETLFKNKNAGYSIDTTCVYNKVEPCDCDDKQTVIFNGMSIGQWCKTHNKFNE